MTRDRMSSIARLNDRVAIAALIVLVAVVLLPDRVTWGPVVATALVGALMVAVVVLAGRAVPPMANLIKKGVMRQPLRAVAAGGVAGLDKAARTRWHGDGR